MQQTRPQPLTEHGRRLPRRPRAPALWSALAERSADSALATPTTDNPRALITSRQRMDCVRLAAAFRPVPPQFLISVHYRKISGSNPPPPYLIRFFSICVHLRSSAVKVPGFYDSVGPLCDLRGLCVMSFPLCSTTSVSVPLISRVSRFNPSASDSTRFAVFNPPVSDAATSNPSPPAEHLSHHKASHTSHRSPA